MKSYYYNLQPVSITSASLPVSLFDTAHQLW
jgi:hypothetical protein